MYIETRIETAAVTDDRGMDTVTDMSDTAQADYWTKVAPPRVWHLCLIIHFLADGGNMLDCACLAGIIAFKHFRRPEVEVIGDEVIVHSPDERAPLPLAIHHTPFCITFAFFPDPTTRPVVDPSLLEQRLSAGLLSIALNAQREICVLQKAGGVPTTPDELLRLLNVAVDLAKDLDKLVEAWLREDWVGRKVEVR
ncbi:hypothetical protein PAXINDRAFT_97747 [Paxillus involutus ATCC 200175]|nr:hypothetical protein PAXINDRAFT_97747 [Paxillus involutus ATCC 200175]